MPNQTPPCFYLTTSEAAARCGFSPRTFEKYRVTGDGPRYVKRGKKVLYPSHELDTWMAAGIRRSTTHSGRAA